MYKYTFKACHSDLCVWREQPYKISLLCNQIFRVQCELRISWINPNVLVVSNRIKRKMRKQKGNIFFFYSLNRTMIICFNFHFIIKVQVIHLVNLKAKAKHPGVWYKLNPRNIVQNLVLKLQIIKE